eukprot:SAG31_NODE_38156_length_298_cov_1.090452_1_plen_37_part_10
MPMWLEARVRELESKDHENGRAAEAANALQTENATLQ